MNSIEEKLWNYIDGNCTPEDQQAIARLIEHDDLYKRKYAELLSFNAEFANMELDEPSMAFTYNVMEQIRAEQAAKPLKAIVDQRIVRGIAAFFLVTISVLLLVALSTVNWSAGGAVRWEIPQIQVPDPSNPFMQGFLFFDLILGLYLFDAWLRRKKIAGSM
ncbi:hypothetical protein DJ568_16315 [Mucilaginibacter hurinus]|uniref:Zf-HC2 domain-containing protein n=1 Tax=Mucilaginibacter hurinus TaxID=2201324 RepID=A0A367GKF6_9SPHI|nr:hypothetical protein [Mucilaginibacter hurinus]RCH53800.1 hypothetical protein DJ568_16315 [Mucilaginibacter hurinus]